MIRKTVFFSLLFLLPFAMISMNCSKEVSKTPKLVKPDTVPPSHAWITGVITEIEPIANDINSDGPCSKAPCIAKVKVESAEYGSAFSVFSRNKEYRMKFEFTLNETSKELFPNMDESYPGLKVGDEFTALVGNIDAMEGQPMYKIYGYSIK